jgi:SOS response regulatory protein OraA/RecX
MDPQLEKFLFSIGSIVVIGIVAYVGYLILLSTPVGKGLNKFMGGVGAVLGAVGAQLDTCATNGMFGKGCYLGWGGVAVGAAFVIGTLASFFKTSINKAIERRMALKNQTEKDAINDVVKKAGGNEGLEKIENDLKAKGASSETIESAQAHALNNAAENLNNETVAEQGNSPAALQENAAIAKQVAAEINEGLSPEDAKEAEDAADVAEPVEPVEL